MNPRLTISVGTTPLFIYARATWECVLKLVKINTFLAKSLLQGFDQMWDARIAYITTQSDCPIWNIKASVS